MTQVIPNRGAVAKALIFDVVREITAEDLLQLAAEGAVQVAAPPLQRLRARHHAVARLVSEGYPDTEIAYRTGYTPQRVRDLKVDPSFIDLVAYYTANRTDAEIEDANRARATLLDIGEIALESILEQLEANPNSISVAERRALAQMAMDRTVAPPKTTAPTSVAPTAITFNIGSRDLKPKVEAPVIDAAVEE